MYCRWGERTNSLALALFPPVFALALVCGLSWEAASQERSIAKTVRCAVAGGLNEIDFWPQLADRFQRSTGIEMVFVATGPKHVIVEAFKAREADVIAMHASDAIINLVADGFGEHPQPWAKNDFVIVGPASDPAKIKGTSDAVAAIGQIIAGRSKLLLHASSGASELMSDLLAAGEFELDPQTTLSLPGDKHRQMLRRAAEEQAYTLVGRIPFLSGKIERGGLEIMVQGDERLRRPYLIVTTTRREGGRDVAARKLIDFLRSAETQAFIAGFGKGRFDERSLLFPVSVGR